MFSKVSINVYKVACVNVVKICINLCLFKKLLDRTKISFPLILFQVWIFHKLQRWRRRLTRQPVDRECYDNVKQDRKWELRETSGKAYEELENNELGNQQ